VVAGTDAAHEGQSKSGRSRALRALLVGVSIGLIGCGSYDVTLGAVSAYRIQATSCGTWDSAGAHTTDEYFVGHSSSRANETLAYFVFDLGAVAGKTVTNAALTLPGTNDWQITKLDPRVPPSLLFKLEVTPLPAQLNLMQVTQGNGDPQVYQDVFAEQLLGFSWVASGATSNTYDAFHYDTGRLQAAVNAGGLYPLFAVSRYGTLATTEEYLYGQSTLVPGIVLNIDVE
jgi:hypothetical protein